jgi:hypothetical protein
VNLRTTVVGFVGVMLGWVRLGAAEVQPELMPLLSNGPTSSRINIVILSEGYTSDQLSQFTNDAMRVLNAILDTAPFNGYRNHFNGFAIPVASVESGSDHPSRDVYRDTYFNSTFDSFGTDRLITIPPNDRDGTYARGKGKVDALLEELMPEFDVSILIVNDTEYGGSGGVPVVTSVNRSSAEIVVHELGHSFSGLGDEYDGTFFTGSSEHPNTTQQTVRDRIKWRDWILASTPIPTPELPAYAEVVGLFEGANYQSTGWYRPKLNCKMRTLGVPFCEVCEQTLVRSIYRQLPPIETASPAQTNLTIYDQQLVSFSLKLITPVAHSLIVEWLVNEMPVSKVNSNSPPQIFDFDPRGLAPGQHLVRVRVADPTAVVRTDPEQWLVANRTWIVSVVSSPRLQMARTGTGLEICWTTNHTNFVLESGALPGAEWAPVTVVPHLDGTNQCVPVVPDANAHRVFRLRAQP